MALTEVDAVLAGGAAALTTAALTPLAARLARRVGAVDEPRERGLAERETPLLGGLAILAGVVLAPSAVAPARRHAPRSCSAPRSSRPSARSTTCSTCPRR